MPDQLDLNRTRHLTTEIVSAYVRNHNLGASDLPSLITSVHQSLDALVNPVVVEPAARVPAVPWKRSITAENVICMECGWRGKTLKRHLSAQHSITADEYRKRWNLPSDFPMTAINYSKQRSQLAKDLGLGRRPGTATATVALNPQPEPEAESEAADKQPEGETSSPPQETATAAPASETPPPEPAAQQPTAQPAAQKRNATRKAGTAKKTRAKTTGGKRTAAKPAKAKATSKRSAAKTAPRRRAAKKETAAPAAST